MQTSAHEITDPGILAYAKMVHELHEDWSPHPGQIPIGKALLKDGVKEVFVQAGRNFGKTELISYLLWRWALSHPNSENYYFAPYMKQAREIVWASRRLQTLGPQSRIDGKPNDTEMRIRFRNGSFLKVDGSDNVEAYRGVKPRGLTVFDEFKDFRPEFYEAYDPNRAAHDTPLLIIGTPPDRDGQFIQVASEFKKDPKKRFFWAPSEQNPFISRDWLEKKKSELYLRGEGDVWEREYMARFVKGGASKLFPMLSSDIIKPHERLLSQIRKDRKKLIWIQVNDPAAASCFASLFIAINPYTKHIYCLDEIYEQSQLQMTVKLIGARIIEQASSLYDQEEAWRFVYDEAETWWAHEFQDHFKIFMEPSRKALNDKESGLTLIKDILLGGHLSLSDRCSKLYWEMDNYFKDKQGRVPKKNDHLIDCFRYALGAAYYSLQPETEYNEATDEGFRGAKISDDFPSLSEDYGALSSHTDFEGDNLL